MKKLVASLNEFFTYIRGPAALLAGHLQCLLKYPPAVISKWKSQLHGRSFGSDRYSEYFPHAQDFSISLPLRLSARQCMGYIITLASKIPLTKNTLYSRRILKNIHDNILRISISRNSKSFSWRENLRRILSEWRNFWIAKDLWWWLLWSYWNSSVVGNISLKM